LYVNTDMTTDDKIKKALDALIKEVKPEIWTNPADQSDDDTLGIILSKYVEWSGDRIEKVAQSAFEDANYSDVEIIIN
jgi:hypothetical protein